MTRTQMPAFSLGVGPHAADTLVVTRFSGTETLSRLYDFHVEFFSKEGQPLELGELSNVEALLTIRIGKAPLRYVHGRVQRAEALGRLGGRWVYRVRVLPELERLCQRRNSRIFQELSVPDIVSAVLTEWRVQHRVVLSRAYRVDPAATITRFTEP